MNADGSEPIANIVVNAEDALKVHVPIRARHEQAPDRLGTVGLASPSYAELAKSTAWLCV